MELGSRNAGSGVHYSSSLPPQNRLTLPSLSSLRSKANRLRTSWHQVDTHPDRKPRRQIAQELLACRRTGISPQFYLERLLYQNAAGNPADYLSKAETQALWDLKRKPDGYLRVFNDKTLFDEHLRREGCPPIQLPTCLGQTRASILLRPDHADVRLQDRAAFGRALADMAERSPTGRVFAKPVNDKKGAGAMLIRSPLSEQTTEEVRERALRVDYFFQEAIDQHPEINRLHPGCLNTLRILTGTANDGSFPSLSAVLRVGQGSKPIDNSHAGGLVVGVDLETGQLRPRAHVFFQFGGATHERHPETGVAFDGFEVPFFAEAVGLAQRAHSQLPLLYVGWDIGISPDGPVLIEGNSGPYIAGLEIPVGGFKADPVARAFLVEHGVVSDGAAGS